MSRGNSGHATPEERKVAGPGGGQRAIFTADGTLDRAGWGLTWNVPLGGGALLVSTGIRIGIDLEAVLQP